MAEEGEEEADSSDEEGQEGSQNLQHRNPLEVAMEQGLNEGLNAAAQKKDLSSAKEISRYIDRRRMRIYQERIARKIYEEKDNWDDEQKIKFARDAMARYAARGKILNDKGSLLFFGVRRENKSGLERAADEASSQDEEDRTVEEATSASRGILNEISKNPSFAKRYEGLTRAAIDVNDSGTFYNINKHLYVNKRISKGQYETAKRELRHKVVESEEVIGREYQKHTSPKKLTRVAAVIIGIVGAAMLLYSGMGLTGNVIGSGGRVSLTALIGAGMLLWAIIVFILSKEKKKVYLNPAFLQ